MVCGTRGSSAMARTRSISAVMSSGRIMRPFVHASS